GRKDPFERMGLMEGVAKMASTEGPKQAGKIGATKLAEMPGAGPINKPVTVTETPSVGKKKSPLASGCAPVKFTGKPVSELLGYGPISCAIGEFLREE